MNTPFDTSAQVDVKIDNVKKAVDKDMSNLNSSVKEEMDNLNSSVNNKIDEAVDSIAHEKETIQSIINNGFDGVSPISVKPETDRTELAKLDNGIYRASGAGTYQFFPALDIVKNSQPNVIPEGYSVKFLKDANGWSVSVVEALSIYDDTALVNSYYKLETNLKEVDDKVNTLDNRVTSDIETKVTKIEGKGLSSNDFTDSDKLNLNRIETSGDGKSFLANDGTYKKGASGSGSGFYNVNQKKPLDSGYYTLETALSVVGSDDTLEQSQIVGMVITFESENNVWSDYVYIGKSLADLKETSKWVEKSIKNVVKSVDLYKGVEKSTLTPDSNGNIIIEIPDIQVDDSINSSSTNPIANNAVSAMFDELDVKYGASVIVNNMGEGVYSLSLLDINGQVISTTESFSGGGNGGGSVATTRVNLTKLTENPTVKAGDEVKLQYIYDQIDTTSESSTGNSATATITVSRGATSNSYTKVLAAGATDTIDVTEYLAVGTSTVRVRVITNDEAMQVSSISWQVNVVQLRLESSYNIATRYTRGQSVNIPYSLTGAGSKTLRLYVDGLLAEDKVITTSTSTGTFTYDTSKLGHGTHSFQLVALLEVNETITILSNSIYFGVIITESARSTPVIGIKIDYSDGTIIPAGEQAFMPVKQYESYEIIYAVYNPQGASTDVEVKVGSDVISKTSVLFVRTSLTNRVSLSGDLESYIKAGSTTLAFTTRVDGLDIDVSEPTDGLLVRLVSSNRTNADVDRAEWNSLGITSKLENFTWVGNGWVNGVLRHTDKAKTTINLKPLTPANAPNNATSIEFKFKVTNLISDTQQLISCIDSAGIGFVITGQEARMVTRGGSEVSTKFSTDEEYNIGFVSFPIAGSDATEYDKLHSGMLYLYVNGIMSGGVKRGDADSLYQNTETNIVMTANGNATLDVYSVKVFRKPLTDSEMLNTYLTGISNTDTLLNKFLENNILDANGNVSVESLPKSLPYMIITGVQENGVTTVMQAAVNNNKDTRYNVDEILYVNPSKPSKNFKLKNGSIRLQGTSSLAYPIKNYRIYMYDTAKVRGELRIGVDAQGLGGTIKADSKYSFKDATSTQKASIPVDCFCLKADYAESSSSHNTGTAVIVGEALNATGDLTPAQKNVSKDYQYDVRTTVDGFPMVLFYRATVNDEPIFLSKFNFNNDKSTEDVFGFKSIPGYHDQPWVTEKFGGTNPTECWEFLNNDYPMGMFLDADFDSKDANGVPNWTKVFEARYIHDEDLVDQFEAGTLKPTRLETLVKWVNSTASNPTKFKNELANYFDVKHLCDYYMITDMLGAVDQRVKNMMMGFWYNPDVDKVLAYMIFYDNDTILGVRNDGKLKYDWTIDEETTDPELSTSSRPVYAFAGHDSVLWKNLRSQFATELGDAYRRLRAKMTNDYIFSIYDTAQSNKFSERLYNVDAINKYIIPATKGVEVVQNGQVTYQTYDYLEAMQGSRLSHRHYWLINRLNFFDAKYNTGAYRSTDINWKGNSASGAKVTAVASRDYYFAFTRESAVQAQQFVKAGGTFTYTYNQEANIGTIFHLYGGDWMKKLDLSAWGGFTSLSLPRLKVLEELVLGSALKTYTLPTIAIGNSLPLLKKIDITNYTGLSVLDLSGCPNLEEVVARGCTSLSNIALYGGAPITKLTLPSNYKNLSLSGLPNLTNSGLVFENLGNLESASITNCPQFNANTFLNTFMNTEASNRRYLRLDMGNMEGDGSILKRLSEGNYGGVTASGSLSADTINLIGTYTLTSWLDEEVLKTYRTKFPELTIKQVPYTMISYPTDVADPQKLTNLDNNTGYGTGNAYEVSGHIKKILDLREYVMIKPNGLKGIVYCPIDKSGSGKYKDGFNPVAPITEGKLCVHEPRFYYKGVNDFVNKKNYMVWAWTEDGLPPTSPRVISYDREYINKFKTADKLVNPTATDLSSIKVTNILYDSYRIAIPSGAKKVRVQLPISTDPKVGAVFTDDNSVISTYESRDDEALMVVGMYTVLDIPTDAKYIEYCLPKSYTDKIKLLFSYSDKIEDVEDIWVKSNETFINYSPNTSNTTRTGRFLNYSDSTTKSDKGGFPGISSTASEIGNITNGNYNNSIPNGVLKTETHYDNVRSIQINTIFNLAYCKYGTFKLSDYIYGTDTATYTTASEEYVYQYGTNNPIKFDFNTTDTVINPLDTSKPYIKIGSTYIHERYNKFMGYNIAFGGAKVGRFFSRNRLANYANFNYKNVQNGSGWGKVHMNETYMIGLPVIRSLTASNETYVSTYAVLPSTLDNVDVLLLPNNGATFTRSFYNSNDYRFYSLSEFETEDAVLINDSSEFTSYPSDLTKYRYIFNDSEI